MLRRLLGFVVLCSILAFTGCEIDIETDIPDADDVVSGYDSTSSSSSSSSGSNSGNTGSASDELPVSLSSVTWLHSDVSGWSRTANLSSVSIGGGKITLNYDKASVWPAKTVQGASLNANPWVFVEIGGKWYAGTWEWLRPGQTTKGAYSVNGDHIKRSPLSSWSPSSGSTYGFMVSGLARTGDRNVLERSNVKMATWP